MKEAFSLRTVRKKILMLSKLAGAVLIFSYIFSTGLPVSEDASFLFWLGFVFLLIIGIVYLVLKLTHWDSMQMGSAPVLLGVFFIGAVQLFCFGLLGEYIGIISERSKSRNRPLAIVEERINFDS